ncbi:MAG: PAS domain S-box protein [Deltaproteobacteria bacterium]|nr:PAS domain S-box protein [Deltaproteobacteria bacterium]
MTAHESQKHEAFNKRRVPVLLDSVRAVLRYRKFDGAVRVIFDACKALIGATAGYVAIPDETGRENNLEKREQLFRSIVETARDAIISIDHLGHIVLWNRGAEVLFGFTRNEILGKPLTRIIPERLKKPHRKRLAVALETQKFELLSKTVETVGLRKDGTEFPVELSLAMWTASKGVFFTGIVRDITDRQQAREALKRAYDNQEKRVAERTKELLYANRALKAEIAHRKQAQEAARQSRRQYQELWDNAPVAYHTLDSRGNITRVNATEAAMLGYTREEMLGRPIFDFILPEQRQEARQRFALKLSGRKVPKHGHRVYVKKDGSRINMSIDDVLEFNGRGEVIGIRTTMVDVTSQKRAERALQESREALRRLSVRLLRAQEDERKRIAGELHDSIGQSLAAIKFVAESARNQIDHQDADGSKESLNALIPLIQQAADEVRRIHTDLRPSLLDDLGIHSTISWFCREFERVYQNIRIEKQLKVEEKLIPQQLKIIIFRILQEAMNNVSKHSRARHVQVSMRKVRQRLEFMIKDDGTGFDPDNYPNSKEFQQGFGVASMKERTELSGGRFVLESAPGSGTTIRASWPM